MNKKRYIILLLTLFVAMLVSAQGYKRKPTLNLQQSDQQRLHFGFALGLNFPDFSVRNKGYIAEDGTAMFAETTGFIPGFTVGVISDLRLCEGLNLRFVPTLYFGERKVNFVDSNTGKLIEDEGNPVSMKSTYVYFPLYLKYSAFRHLNHKPYLIAGGGPAIDCTRKKGELLLLKSFDVFVEVGVGWTFYLKYFRFSPEFKFCLGTLNMNEKNRTDLLDPSQCKFTNTISKLTSRLFVVTFNFE